MPMEYNVQKLLKKHDIYVFHISSIFRPNHLKSKYFVLALVKTWNYVISLYCDRDNNSRKPRCEN